MSEGKFYWPDEVRPIYEEIVPVYQSAFKEAPWNSATKCVDGNEPKRCKDSFSALEIGELCATCTNCPIEEAFTYETLEAAFDNVGNSRPTVWYMERSAGKIALVMFAWVATPERIAIEKYGNVPDMKSWMRDKLGEDEICWLDEVFADKTVREKGNLRNFKAVCLTINQLFSVNMMAYRTVQPKMTHVAERFGPDSEVLRGADRSVELGEIQIVPDWRDFVVIQGGKIRQ